MNQSDFFKYAAMLISSVAFTGCGKEPPASEKKADGGTFQSAVKSDGDPYQTNLLEAFVSKDIQAGGKCFVDSFNGQLAKPKNEVFHNVALTIDGWAIDASGMAAKNVAVELAALDGSKKYYAPAQRSVRPGLGQALGNPALDNASLQSTASLNIVLPGQYSVRVIVGGDKTVNRCDPNILLVVN